MQLWDQSGDVHLVISDFGKEDSTLKRQRKAKVIGLMSMRECIRLVSGTIAFKSNLEDGTTIHVQVPVGQCISLNKPSDNKVNFIIRV